MTLGSSVEEPKNIRGLSIERLVTLCRVAQVGSFVDAAGGDPNKQSQFSRQIKDLEGFLGARLFVRKGKHLQLTDTGKNLALTAQSFFKAVEAVRLSAADEAETIRIGAGESIFRWRIFPKLKEIQFSSPPLKLDFTTQRTAKAVECVIDGSLDLAIVRSDVCGEPLASERCGSLNYILVVPRTLLPQKISAGITLLNALPFATLNGEGAFTRGIQQIAKDAGVTLNIGFRAENFPLLVAALETVDLAAVIPLEAASMLSDERYAKLPLPQLKTLKRDLCIAYHPKAAEIRPTLRRVVSRLCKALSI